MVKILSVFILLATLLLGETVESDFANTESLLTQKIKTFVNEDSFYKNREFIKLIFSPEDDFYNKERINVVKVVETLKENGLLSLFFKEPQELNLSFKTSASPLFFVKIMGDTLRNIGYYRYVTTESSLDSTQFTWNISLKSEYATDPLILQEELNKSGAEIIDIVKYSDDNWEYNIDTSSAYLNVPTLVEKEKFNLKRSLYAHWLDIQKINNLKIKSSLRDKWYPEISYYDQYLHLLEVIKKDKRTKNLFLVMPNNAKYIKISDMYTLKNVKDSLVLEPSGSR